MRTSKRVTKEELIRINTDNVVQKKLDKVNHFLKNIDLDLSKLPKRQKEVV